MATDGRGARRWAVAVLAAVVVVMSVGVPGSAPAGAVGRLEGDPAWVRYAYLHLLGREPGQAQMQHRLGQLASGRSRRSVAEELAASREHAGRLVDGLYLRILGRAPAASGREYWTDRLVAGERVSTAASFFYGSPEVFGRAGGTAEGYVTFLYRDVLGREPDVAGAAYWTARIEAGANRTALARSWYLSGEATGLRAGLLFLDLLHRPPSVAERVAWAERLRRVDVRPVTAALMATAGATIVAESSDRSIRLTGGDRSSREPSISGSGRFVAFTSAASDLTAAPSPPGDDIFVLDRLTGRMRAITAGDGPSGAPEISADGSRVVFQSAATDLVAGDVNGHVDVFRAPTAGGPIERLTDGDGDSTGPTTSGDGSTVAFTSAATNLVDDDPNGEIEDVFVHTDGPPATLERIGGTSATTATDVSDDGGTLGLRGRDLDGVPHGLGTHAYLARLPLSPDPELVRLSEILGGGTTLSADGTRAGYVETRPVAGSYMSASFIATVGDGAVTDRTRVGSLYKPSSARISSDGRVLLQTGWDFTHGAVDRMATRDGEPIPIPIPLPPGSDLTADGRMVVGSLGGQLRLYEAG